jgi:hypothetical protein
MEQTNIDSVKHWPTMTDYAREQLPIVHYYLTGS